MTIIAGVLNLNSAGGKTIEWNQCTAHLATGMDSTQRYHDKERGKVVVDSPGYTETDGEMSHSHADSYRVTARQCIGLSLNFSPSLDAQSTLYDLASLGMPKIAT